MTPTPEQIRERARWVRDLLHAGLDQGREALRLRDPDGHESFCCLGVRLRQVNPLHSRLQFKPHPRGDGLDESEGGTLPDDELEKLGWDDADQEAAYSFNDDDDGWSFEDIARGIAWTTAENIPFRYLFAGPVPGTEDDPDGPEHSTSDVRTVPDDFDVEAWLTEVLG